MISQVSASQAQHLAVMLKIALMKGMHRSDRLEIVRYVNTGDFEVRDAEEGSLSALGGLEPYDSILELTRMDLEALETFSSDELIGLAESILERK